MKYFLLIGLFFILNKLQAQKEADSSYYELGDDYKIFDLKIADSVSYDINMVSENLANVIKYDTIYCYFPFGFYKDWIRIFCDGVLVFKHDSLNVDDNEEEINCPEILIVVEHKDSHKIKIYFREVFNKHDYFEEEFKRKLNTKVIEASFNVINKKGKKTSIELMTAVTRRTRYYKKTDTLIGYLGLRYMVSYK